MFFYLAKAFWFFAQPSSLLLVMILGSVVLLRAGWDRAGRSLVAMSATLLLVGGSLPLGNLVLLPLEQRFWRADLAGKPVDGIIVLGGGEDERISAARNAHALNEAAERITETLALARRYPNAKIVFTGGPIAPRLIFHDFGLLEGDRLIIESKALEAWENAVNVNALIRPIPGERWPLVTSASHMPRAIGVFRKVGLLVEPWPVDYRTASSWDVLRISDSPADGLKRLDTAMREWVGLVAYRASGRIDALFPGPQ